jgi:hypothetical protein
LIKIPSDKGFKRFESTLSIFREGRTSIPHFIHKQKRGVRRLLRSLLHLNPCLA